MFKRGFPEVAPNETPISYESMERIKDCSAGGIYTYLISMPDDWEFDIEKIENQFDLSKKFIRKKLEVLQELGYLDIDKETGKPIVNFVAQRKINKEKIRW